MRVVVMWVSRGRHRAGGGEIADARLHVRFDRLRHLGGRPATRVFMISSGVLMVTAMVCGKQGELPSILLASALYPI